MPSSSRFIIESNAIMLGIDKRLIDLLQGLHNVTFRVAVKADSPLKFEQITGAKAEFQTYQLEAIKALRASCIDVSVAFMDDFVNPHLLGFGYDEDYDIESLRYYRGTKSRLIKRGLIDKPSKLKKPVYIPELPIKPKSAPYWEDKGDDIT